MLSCVRLSVTLWTVGHQASLPIEFSRQENRSGLLFPSPGDLPYPGVEPTSAVSPALTGGFFTIEPPGKPFACSYLPLKMSSHFPKPVADLRTGFCRSLFWALPLCRQRGL